MLQFTNQAIFMDVKLAIIHLLDHLWKYKIKFLLERIAEFSLILLFVKKTEIDDNCFISHGVVFVNDLFRNGKRSFGNKKKWKGAKVGKSVLIGSNATILPVNICKGTVIGAGAVVTKDIIKKGIYVGNPAKMIKRIND